MYKKIVQHPRHAQALRPTSCSRRRDRAEETRGADQAVPRMLDAGQQTVSPVLSNFKSSSAVDWAPSSTRVDRLLPTRRFPQPNFEDGRKTYGRA